MKIIASIKSIAFLLILFFASMPLFAADYYWVGGSGNWSDINHWRTTSGGNSLPTVVPGRTDDVYFDANSGFTNTSRTIIIDVTANCRNITFSNNSVAPNLTQNGSQILNIYGSSEWQTGMGTIQVSAIYYRHNGIPKTIKSNGVIIGIGKVYLEEETNVDLLDDLFIGSLLSHLAGTFNTHNHKITLEGSFYSNEGDKVRTLNLGSSEIIMNRMYVPVFATNSSSVIVNAGTSHIRFTKYINPTDSYGFMAYPGQEFYNVSFEGEQGTLRSPYHNSATSDPVKFNKVVFKGSGFINGNNNYKTLVLKGGEIYSLGEDRTQTVTHSLTAQTEVCEGWTTIESSIGGKQARLVVNNTANLNISGAIIKDIHASGGADFTVSNSVDNGNNVGWNFTPSIGQNLYWVGGEGNWDDKNHWSNTSGGIGGYCVPGPSDNVFFDEKSGFMYANMRVTVNNVAHCHDITFSGCLHVPYFAQNDSSLSILNIYGSSEWQSGMKSIDFKEIYYRNTNAPKTIKSNGVKTGEANSTVYFEEETLVSLLDALYISYDLKHSAGTFNTNNYNLIIGKGFFANEISKPRMINLGSSEIRLNSEHSIFNTSSPEVNLNAGTSHIIFTKKVPNSYGIKAANGHVFHDITFLGTRGEVGEFSQNSIFFNRVEFVGDGFIKGNNTFNTLVFAPGNTYKMQDYSTQKITNLFSLPTPLCGNWTFISANTPGYKATISAPASATINVSRAIIKDIQAVGGANFTVSNSIDSGNNSGWNFSAYTGQDLYWVGGSGNWNDKAHWSVTSGGIGGDCIPGPGDDVFFNIDSGFTNTDKTITIADVAHCRNITFSGSVVPPTVVQNGKQTLNIYGSSEWQEGMGEITVSHIYYRHTGVPKNIKTNGVLTGALFFTGIEGVYLEEETSVDLLDNYNSKNNLYFNAGTLNTNNFDIRSNQFYSSREFKKRILNLGSSNIYTEIFNSSSESVTLNAGTSHIYIEKGGFCDIYDKQVFNNVSFLGKSDYPSYINTLKNSSGNGEGFFNRVEFKEDGIITSNNTFKELIFNEGKTYKLTADKTQNIESWILGGTPCNVTFIESSVLGSRTNINVTGETTHFNFTNIKDLNGIGKTLHFGEQSTVANQNNINITYDPYNPGAFNGLGSDWLCHEIDETNPLTYRITTELFYGNNETTYKWYKLNDPNHDPLMVIAMSDAIDIRDFGGFGTYKVMVSYSDGSSITCEVPSTIDVVEKTPFPEIVGLEKIQGQPVDGVIICKKQTNTLTEIIGNGTNIKWYTYETSSITIDPNTVIENGQIYYVTQTLDDCESNRMPITIVIKNCFSPRVNPGIRMRVAN